MEALDQSFDHKDKVISPEKPRVSPQIILILGPELSGKSEQARILSKRTNLPLIGAGEAFRELQDSYIEKLEKSEEPSSLEVRAHALLTDPNQAYSDSKLFEDIMRWRFTQKDPIEKFQKGFVLEGAPRTKEQFESFERIFFDLGLEMDIKAVYLTVSSKERDERQSQRLERDDDAKLNKRLEEHYKDFKFNRRFAREKWDLKVIHTTNKSIRDINEEIVDKLALDRPLLLRYREAKLNNSDRESYDWLSENALADIQYDVLNSPLKDRSDVIQSYLNGKNASVEGLSGNKSWDYIQQIEEFLNSELKKLKYQ